MSDKELIIKTLDFIKYKNGHVKIKDFWDELNIDNDTQAKIKIKLEDNNLATPHIYDAWSLMITTLGLKIKSNDLRENGNLKKKIVDKEYLKGIKTTLLGILIGFLLTAGFEVIKVKWISPPSSNTIVLPPIQIVHDTIYIKSDSLKKITPKP